MKNKAKDEEYNNEDFQDDIYASFSTKEEEEDNTTENTTASYTNSNLGSSMHNEKYQKEEPEKKDNYLETHTVVTTASKFSRLILYGFYALLIFLGIFIFLMLRADRYEFYLKEEEINLSNGSSYQIELTPKNERYFSYLNYDYEIADSSIATVDEFGKVTAVGTGTTTLKISISPGFSSKKMRVVCDDTPVTSITLMDAKSKTKNSVKINNNETITLKAAMNNKEDLVTTVNYSSSNNNVATVDKYGNVTAVGPGTATITGTRDNVTGSINVTVTNEKNTATNIAVTGVSLNKKTLSLSIGGSQSLDETVSPSNATNKDVTWSSSDKSIATVSSSGVVKGIKAGSATITVTTKDGSKKASCTVTVSGTKSTIVNVTGISLNKKTLSVNVGKTATLKATVAPSNATNQEVTWSSSNTSVATVSSSGVVKGVKAGSVTITVTTKDGNKKASCTVTVNSVNNTATPTTTKITQISFGSNQIEKTVGDKVTLNPTLTPASASSSSLTWSSSNTSVATVSNSGVVTTKAKGQANITASADGVSATVAIIVRENETNSTAPATATAPSGTQISAAEVTLTPTSLTVEKGKTATFTIKVTKSMGMINVKSSNTKILTVTPTSISAEDETIADNCQGGSCFFDKWTITYTVKGVAKGTAYVNVDITDLVSYDEAKITGSGKIGVLVK